MDTHAAAMFGALPTLRVKGGGKWLLVLPPFLPTHRSQHRAVSCARSSSPVWTHNVIWLGESFHFAKLPPPPTPSVSYGQFGQS